MPANNKISATCCLLICIILLSVSCNTYKYANLYSDHEIKKSGLSFHFIRTKKYNITYWDSKTNKPVLLLIHGFGTSGKFQWFKEAKALSAHYRLIIANLLYFGSKPRKPDYTIEGQV